LATLMGVEPQLGSSLTLERRNGREPWGVPAGTCGVMSARHTGSRAGHRIPACDLGSGACLNWLITIEGVVVV